MNTATQINAYLESHPEPKRSEMATLHKTILKIAPNKKLWFLDGKDETGKTVSNPNIGYGQLNLKYANGKTRPFYQVGLSANSTGISIYIMGIEDKNLLKTTFAANIGKASITGYCIKFKTLKDINSEVLEALIRFGFEEK